MSKYDEEDIAAVSLDINSSELFSISPPSLAKLKNYLRENVTVKFRYSISVLRLSHDQSDVVEENLIYYMRENDEARQQMIRIIQDGQNDQRVHLPFLFPKFLKVFEYCDERIFGFSSKNWIFFAGNEFERSATDFTISRRLELSQCYAASEQGRWHAMVATIWGLWKWRLLPRSTIEASTRRLCRKYRSVHI